MVHEAVAERYASALFELGRGAEPRQLLDELRDVERTLDQHPDLARALQAPNVPTLVKKDICRRMFSSGNPYILNLFLLLVDKSREAYIPAIVRQYRKLLDRLEGVARVSIETAVPMTPDVQSSFETALVKKEGLRVKIIWQVNPDPIGGYVVRIGDRLLDRSLAAQLNGLQRKLEGVT